MFEDSDTVVLRDELAYQDVLPVSWHALPEPLEEAMAASFAERNIRLLQAHAAIEDHGGADKPDEPSPDITRLDFKMNLLLDLVGQLLIASRPRPASVAIRFNALGAVWRTAAPAPQAPQQGILEIHLRDFLAEPLRLAGTLESVTPEGDVTVGFAPVGEVVADLMEKLIFRHHRRQIAGSRQPRRSR